jgi:outer membrane murein-binding lipoprotein Lpp
MDGRGEVSTAEQDLIMARNVIEQLNAHNKQLTKERNQFKEDAEANAADACRYEDALVGNIEFTKHGMVNKFEQTMNRIRDLIAIEGELGDLKESHARLLEVMIEAQSYVHNGSTHARMKEAIAKAVKG